MLIEGHGSIVAGIGRVSALDHPWVRCATTADAPQRGGMRQHVLKPRYIRVASCIKTFCGAGLVYRRFVARLSPRAVYPFSASGLRGTYVLGSHLSR